MVGFCVSRVARFRSDRGSNGRSDFKRDRNRSVLSNQSSFRRTGSPPVAPSLRSFGPATVARSCSSSARFGKAHRATHARARKAHPANPRGLRTRASPSGAAVVSHEEGALAHARCARARGIRFLLPSGGTSRRPRFGADDAAASPRIPRAGRPGERSGSGSARAGPLRQPPNPSRASRRPRVRAPPHASPTPRPRRARDHVRFGDARISTLFPDRWRRLTRPSPVPRAGRTRAWRPRPAEPPLRRHGGQGRARHPGPQPRQGGRRRPPRPGAPSPRARVGFFRASERRIGQKRRASERKNDRCESSRFGTNRSLLSIFLLSFAEVVFISSWCLVNARGRALRPPL